MRKQYFFSGVIALIVSVVTFVVLSNINAFNNKIVRIEHINDPQSSSVKYNMEGKGSVASLDFTQTAGKVVNAVVNVKSSYVSQRGNVQRFQDQQIPDQFKDFFGDDNFKFFFGPQGRNDKSPRNMKPDVQVATGSGVIINENGYIVTNNHVIANADDIEVTLHDNRTYKATVVGTDPSTDLALIQIKEKNLPSIPFSNSDIVKVGEWVLAVGNPFSLTSTVTAGIVSAKARNINILKEQYAIESFIQTDAAINPGNSGGALVNLDGGLVGINSAIASPTGAYTGYGFAIPSNIVNKVVEDLIKFGTVQRGILGIMIRSVDGNLAKDKDLSVTEGVYVDSIFEKSGAGKAGIKEGDVILSVDNEKVTSSPKLQELIARHRPGDVVKITVNRKGSEKIFNVTLINREGTEKLASREQNAVLNVLGCELVDIDKKTAKKLDIDGGVKISKLFAGILKRQTQIREGFIITRIDNQKITKTEDVLKLLENHKGGVMMEGVYEDIPGNYYYAFGM